MKNLLLIFVLISHLGWASNADYKINKPLIEKSSITNSEKNISNTSMTIAFDGPTCKCANSSVGDTAEIGGVTYTVVDNSTIGGQITAGNFNLCTTLVTNMEAKFYNTSFNSDISFWDTSNVTNMQNMLGQCPNFNQDISA